MNIGEKIQQLRRAAGLSQEQLAEAVAVSRQAISKWETGQSLPEIDNIMRLCKAFAITSDELLSIKTERLRDTHIEQREALDTTQMNHILREGLRKRQFTLGWITMLVGGVLLIGYFASLWLIWDASIKTATAIGTGFYLNPIEYMSVAPMPHLFLLTLTIIAFGAGLTVFSLAARRRK